MKFARRFAELQQLFPGSSAEQLYPREANDFIQPVALIPAHGDRLNEFANFAIQGAAGISPVSTTAIPTGRVMYVYWFVAFHNDAVARRILITMHEENTGLQVEIYDTAANPDKFAGGVVASNVVVTLRNIVVPPGFKLSSNIVGIVAPGAGTIEGCVGVLPLSEPPPPLF